MTEPVIEAQGLGKRYGDFVAVESLDLSIGRGEVFGLLGPNGSGKTTTILMLMGLTEVTTGSIRVAGLDPTRQPLRVKSKVGYLPDAVGFYDNMTAAENLRYSGRLAGLFGARLEERIAASLARVSLTEVADKHVRAFSRGMRQRLGLADVLLKQPEIAILDEPTNGLDPQSTHEFLTLISELKAEGLTILLSSHLLERVEPVCDRVGLFHRGRMVLEGRVDALARRVLGGGHEIVVEVGGAADVGDALARIGGVNRVERDASGAFRLHAERDVRPEVGETVRQAGGTLVALGMTRPSLDDVYTHYFEELDHAT